METRLFCSDFVPFSLKVSHPGPGYPAGISINDVNFFTAIVHLRQEIIISRSKTVCPPTSSAHTIIYN